ncbi:Nitrous oxide reductase maturation transmembrane protein NosY [Paramagnetospirillum magnetotacticum MS-1]|uniref:Nitrous oxide reductase maturation transmembrane protein NosY n=1 Tax=Paramagnetospirillum magnetotacticum MS-1 TaxID=272627 RepID=A0A0C2YK10_PARME|nr:ABC transporter permease subunit [Paramagnetospirillum magnetotacticum]KIM00085.1 Nitrous oxide reductase maturation transmembrane protein NosY [Paramagnetospirillum magnetotacticum MS-1]
MNALYLTARLDMAESLRSRWFMFYSIVFGGIVVLLFVFGLTESRILGFTGLSRLLVTYIQLCVAILPVFILITTVRSVAGDRDAGVFEYMLSLPVPLHAWFWGKMIGRFVVVFLPVFGAMAVAALYAVLRGIGVDWSLFILYTALLVALAWAFLGIGMLISTLARSPDVAQTGAFLTWLVLLLFLDLILLGLMIRERLPLELIVGIALANPLQSFRTAAILLFDPQMVVLGPSSYVILDALGRSGYLTFALAYPVALGTICAGVGYVLFRRGDLP